MSKATTLKRLKGKVIKSADITKRETSDGCAFATFELRFMDGSMFEFQLRSMPAIDGVFFPDEDGDDGEAVLLVKP
jgi:hypothetical protein